MNNVLIIDNFKKVHKIIIPQFQFISSSTKNQQLPLTRLQKMLTTTYTKKKHHKTKATVFHEQVNKPLQLKKIINRLSETYQSNNSKLINDILVTRHKKLSQLRSKAVKNILQGPMIPTSSIQRFSQSKPISTGEKFLLEKFRTNILLPERAYEGKPNVRAGIIDVRKMENIVSQMDDRVISKKFQEFVRIVDDQSGTVKRRRMLNLSLENQSLPSIRQPYKSTMKKTYFKKFPSDNYNFYKPAIKDISRTDNTFQSTIQNQNRHSTERSRTLSKSISRLKEVQLSRQFSPKGLRSPRSPKSPRSPFGPRSELVYHTLNAESGKNGEKIIREGLRTLDAYRNA